MIVISPNSCSIILTTQRKLISISSIIQKYGKDYYTDLMNYWRKKDIKPILSELDSIAENHKKGTNILSWEKFYIKYQYNKDIDYNILSQEDEEGVKFLGLTKRLTSSTFLSPSCLSGISLLKKNIPNQILFFGEERDYRSFTNESIGKFLSKEGFNDEDYLCKLNQQYNNSATRSSSKETKPPLLLDSFICKVKIPKIEKKLIKETIIRLENWFNYDHTFKIALSHIKNTYSCKECYLEGFVSLYISHILELI